MTINIRLIRTVVPSLYLAPGILRKIVSMGHFLLKKQGWVGGLLFLCTWSVCAQTVAQDTSVRFFAVPLLSYSNDTRLGFGTAGILTFRGNPLRSSVTFGLLYTQRKQFLLYFPYQWFSSNGRWRVYGEAGWYRYFYQYFGIGNAYPDDFIETYTAQYPRLRLTVAKRLNARQLVGLRYNLDVYRIVSSSAGSEIDRKVLRGAEGGISSGVGPVWLYDSRDNQFYPHRGWLAEVAVIGEQRLTGSDFEFVRFSLDVARYWALGHKMTLATQAVAQFTAGHAPFFNLSQLGGTKRLRGYPDGKYRDKHLLLGQAEWRFPIFWRFKGAIFVGSGTVFGTANERLRWRPEGGGGLRFEFDKKQQLHLRLDYGIGDGRDNAGFYLTFGEAF